MPQSFIVTAVLRCVRELPGFPRLSLLDLSCGDAHIIAQLQAEGCIVRGTHFCEGDYILGSDATHRNVVTLDPDVDLCERLPYDDGAFDVVLLTEVIEHLPSHYRLVEEIGRILKPGGFLVLSTPNIQRLHSRFHFFWTGTHKLIRRRIGWDLEKDDLYAYHINPVDFPHLHTLLHLSGLHLSSLHFTKYKWGYSFWWLLYPLVWLFTRIETARRVKTPRHREGENDLFHWMMRPEMLFSEQILLVAERKKDQV
jgi:SAM-dependent methyltransferase